MKLLKGLLGAVVPLADLVGALASIVKAWKDF